MINLLSHQVKSGLALLAIWVPYKCPIMLFSVGLSQSIQMNNTDFYDFNERKCLKFHEIFSMEGTESTKIIKYKKLST